MFAILTLQTGNVNTNLLLSIMNFNQSQIPQNPSKHMLPRALNNYFTNAKPLNFPSIPSP